MDVHLDNLTFVWWWVFFLLPLPWLIRLFLPATNDGANGALKVPFFADLHNELGIGNTVLYTLSHGLLLSVIWILLICAVARPTKIGEPISMPVAGRDLMLAIDLSGSMSKRDLRQGRLNRLDVVKASADEFISRREGDRLGLIFFSDRAYLQVPLTFDRKVVRNLLSEASVGLTGKNTAIGDAIAIGLKRLNENQSEIKKKSNRTNSNVSKSEKEIGKKTGDNPKDQKTNQKTNKTKVGNNSVLILLTDGENTAGVMDPMQATEIAKKIGIKIYTIGVGSIRAYQSGGIDEVTLKAIASETGGRYFRSTDAKTLDNVYREIDKLEPTEHDPLQIRPQIALYYYPAQLAFLLAMVFALFVLLKLIYRSILSKKIF